MKEQLYKEPDITTCIYDTEKNSVVVKWHKLSGHDHLRPCLEAQMKCVKEKGAKFVVVDVSSAQGTPTQEDQDWFGTKVFPFFDKQGLKALITILPQSALTKLGAKTWQKTSIGFSFSNYEVGSLKAAGELVQSIMDGKES